MNDRKYRRLYKKANRAGYRNANKYGSYGGTDEENRLYFNYNYTRGYTENVYNSGRVDGTVKTALSCAVIAGVAYAIKKAKEPKRIGSNDYEEEVIFDDVEVEHDDGIIS